MKKSKSPFMVFISGVDHQLGGALVHVLQLSLRDIEELFLERGGSVTCETIRQWCDRLGSCLLVVRTLRAARRVRFAIWMEVRHEHTRELVVLY